MRPQRHRGRGGDLEPRDELSGLAFRAMQQLDPLPVHRARHKPGVAGADRLAPEYCERRRGGRDVQPTPPTRPSRPTSSAPGILARPPPPPTPPPAAPVRRQRHQRPLSVQETHRVACHLLRNAVDVERAREHVEQLAHRKQLRQPAIQLVGGTATLALALPQPALEANRSPTKASSRHGKEDRYNTLESSVQ